MSEAEKPKNDPAEAGKPAGEELSKAEARMVGEGGMERVTPSAEAPAEDTSKAKSRMDAEGGMEPVAPSAEAAGETDAAARMEAEGGMEPTLSEDAARVVELETEVADLKDRLLRAVAETENVRRRAERDRTDASAYGAMSFARDMLQISDNLSRALDLVEDDAKGRLGDDMKAVLEGVELTQRSLISIFERHGITPIQPEMGEKFDPNRHEAMFEVPTGDAPAGSIVQVVETGYLMKDRLLRAARVGVAKAPPA